MAETLITDRRSASAHYKILRRLGKGGMAEVFLARQEGMAGVRRLTVVKKLLPQFSQVADVAEMLLDEARIAAQLTHPNIVQIFELGKDEGQYFIAMEFIDGCDLATLARIERHRQSRVPLRLTLRAVSEAAMGLDYAHRQTGLDGRPLNIVHRDVSPHNILVSREGAVKVTDFGIAKAVGKAQVTQVGVVKGKVQYMSPEQYTGGTLDHRSDIFSLGVVLYQLTVGRLPRVTDSGDIVMRRVVEGKIPRPTEVRADYPDELEGVVMRALAQNPDERYPDAAALRDDLLDFARENDLLAFPKELGDYVNAMVPPTPLVAREPSQAAPAAASEPPVDQTPKISEGGALRGPRPSGRLPSVIVEGEDRDTDMPGGTEVASPQGRRKGSLVISDAHSGPFDRTDLRQVSAPEPSEPALLEDESLTPAPSVNERAAVIRAFSVSAAAEPRQRELRDLPLESRPRAVHAASEERSAPTSPTPTPTPGGPTPAALTTRISGSPPTLAPAPPPSRAHPAVWVVLGVLVAAVGALVAYVTFFRPPPVATKPPPAVEPKTGPPPTTPGAGVINVLANPPHAAVSIDGAQRCPSTPCQIAGLPLNRELLLTLRAPRHTLWMQRLVLTDSEPRLLLRADLAPEAPTFKPTDAAPKKTGEGTRPEEKKAAAEKKHRKGGGGGAAKKSGEEEQPTPTAKAKGKVQSQGKMTVEPNEGGPALLAVDARPWVEVWIDGQKAGHTPLQRELKPGPHKIVLKHPEMGFSKSYRVKAQAGKKVKITEVLQAPQPPGGGPPPG